MGNVEYFFILGFWKNDFDSFIYGSQIKSFIYCGNITSIEQLKGKTLILPLNI